MNSELEQWCEIDGHTWIEYHSFYGLALCPKRHHIYRHCTFCKLSEEKLYIPVDEHKMLLGPIFIPKVIY